MVRALLVIVSIIFAMPVFAQTRAGFGGFSTGPSRDIAPSNSSSTRQSFPSSALQGPSNRSGQSGLADHYARHRPAVTFDGGFFAPGSPNPGRNHWGPPHHKWPRHKKPPHRHPIPSVVIIEVPQSTTIVQPYSTHQPYLPEPYVEPQGLTPVPNAYPDAGVRSPQQVAPFDATPHDVVARILKLAEVKKGDVLYDLGSGDGRVVIAAAKQYGIKAVGFEVDAELVHRARETARKQGVGHLVEFREQDFVTADLAPATVVTLYLSYDGNLKIRPHLLKQLKPGARVVSYTFDMGEWQPKIAEAYWDSAGNAHQLYLWEIGAQLRFSNARR